MPLNDINLNAYICSINNFAALSPDSNTVLVSTEQKNDLDNINDKDFIEKLAARCAGKGDTQI